VHLTAPDSEFFYKLATPFGTILPADTAGKDLGTSPAPTTGPYMFASYDPNKALIMKRNPYFKEFSADAQPAGYPDEIDYAFGLQDEAEVTAVLNGQYDWMFDEKPLDRLSELGSKHANLVRVHPLLAYYYMPLNVNIPPFNNLKARQAVAYGVDRAAIVKLFGGSNLGAPLCQNLPVGMPGYSPYCPFTKKPGSGKWTAPDLAKAKELVKESGTAGQKVTMISSDKVVEKSIGTYLASLLRTIGYDAQLKAISSNIEFTYIQNTNNKVQASLTDWYQDYPAPSDFLYILFGCSSFTPGSDSSINIAGWCDKNVDAEMHKALDTAVTNVEAADKIWSKVDRDVTDAVPAVALFQPKFVDLFGKRVGNYVWSDQIHMLFSQAWVQ
jgi:peptide/nickel transport system substrate-binding protein